MEFKCVSWKMVSIVQNKLGRLFFGEEKGENVPKIKEVFTNFQEKWSNLGHGKL